MIIKKHDLNMSAEELENQRRKTVEEGPHAIEEHFKMELAYWEARDSGNYEDARDILKALEIQRKSKDIEYKLEVQNWKMDIAQRTGNLDLFLNAFATAKKLDTEIAIDGEVMKPTVRNLLVAHINGYLVGTGTAKNPAELRSLQDNFESLLVKKATDLFVGGKCNSTKDFINEMKKKGKETSLFFAQIHQCLIQIDWK